MYGFASLLTSRRLMIHHIFWGQSAPAKRPGAQSFCLLAGSPPLSFLRCCRQPAGELAPADLEAAYRFVNNEKVTVDAMLAPHAAETATRCAALSAKSLIHARDCTCRRRARHFIASAPALHHQTSAAAKLGSLATVVLRSANGTRLLNDRKQV